ncbi:unnamed protein product, partial [Amoebophrya sp. A25]
YEPPYAYGIVGSWRLDYVPKLALNIGFARWWEPRDEECMEDDEAENSLMTSPELPCSSSSSCSVSSSGSPDGSEARGVSILPLLDEEAQQA